MQIFHIGFNKEYLCSEKRQKSRRCDDFEDHFSTSHNLARHTEFVFMQYSIMNKFLHS